MKNWLAGMAFTSACTANISIENWISGYILVFVNALYSGRQDETLKTKPGENRGYYRIE